MKELIQVLSKASIPDLCRVLLKKFYSWRIKIGSGTVVEHPCPSGNLEVCSEGNFSFGRKEGGGGEKKEIGGGILNSFRVGVGANASPSHAIGSLNENP